MKDLSAIYRVIVTIGVLVQPFDASSQQMPARVGDPHGSIEITVVVDNETSHRGLQTSWGFSCVVRGFEKTILFDTGADGTVLMSNLKALDIAPGEIDIVVLSHAHRDHTGGLGAFLAANAHVTVYLLSSSPKPLYDTIRASGAEAVPVSGRTEICRDVYSTGALGRETREHALVLHTEHGLAVITGCAHPGIVEILKWVKGAFPASDILVALGGFHLLRSKRLEKIVTEVQATGTRYIAPGHCTGNAAKRLFHRRFKERFITLDAGARLMVSDHEKKPCTKPACVMIPE